MLDKKLLIRLFLTVLYLVVLYSFARCSLQSLAKEVAVDERVTTYDNPPASSMGKMIKVEKTKSVISYKSLGEFKLTGYCRCIKCCGKSNGITSTGTKAKAGRTIAVDPSNIPYGSIVKINNKEYVAEDCGGAIKGNKIDIFFDTHEEALEWGVKYGEVSIKAGD